MNKVYKSLYNETLGAWVAVSENTKSHGKKSNTSKLAMVAMFFLSMCGVAYPQTQAQPQLNAQGNLISNTNTVTDATDSVVLGKENQVTKLQDSVVLGKKNTVKNIEDGQNLTELVVFGTQNNILTNKSISIGSQTQIGFDQNKLRNIRTRGYVRNYIVEIYGPSEDLASNRDLLKRKADGDKRLQGFTVGRNIALGHKALTMGSDLISIGTDSAVFGWKSIGIGHRNTAFGESSIAIGDKNISSRNHEVVIGTNNNSHSLGGVTIGAENDAKGVGNIAIGSLNKFRLLQSPAKHPEFIPGSIGIGLDNYIDGVDSIVMGTSNHASGRNQVVTGYKNLTESSARSVVSGYNNIAWGSLIAIGAQNHTYYSTGAMMIGDSNYIGTHKAEEIAKFDQIISENMTNYADSFQTEKPSGLKWDNSNIDSLGNDNLLKSQILLNEVDDFDKKLREALKSQEKQIVDDEGGLSNPNNNYNNRSIAFGSFNTILGQYSLAIGYGNKSRSYNTTLIGRDNLSIGEYSQLVGTENVSVQQFASILGFGNRISKETPFILKGNSQPVINGSAVGVRNYVSAAYATGLGYRNTALNTYSTAIGARNLAKGEQSFAGGYFSTAEGNRSLALGYYSYSNFKANAIGLYSVALGDYSNSYGVTNRSLGINSSTFGNNNVAGKLTTQETIYELSDEFDVFAGASGNTHGTSISAENGERLKFLNVFGVDTNILLAHENLNVDKTKHKDYDQNKPNAYLPVYGGYQVALGYNNYAVGDKTLSSGYYNLALGNQSLAVGQFNLSKDDKTSSLGFFNRAMARNATALGSSNLVGYLKPTKEQIDAEKGNFSTAVGYANASFGKNAHTFGSRNIAAADFATAIGHESIASESNSVALGVEAHATKSRAIASGYQAYAYGFLSSAYGDTAHAFGESSLALGRHNESFMAQSFSTGDANKVNGRYSGAYGYANQVNSPSAYAYGNKNIVSSNSSGAFGNFNTIEETADRTYVLGRNVTVANANSVILGNMSESKAATAFTKSQVDFLTLKAEFAGIANEKFGVVSVGAADKSQAKDTINLTVARAIAQKDLVQNFLSENLKYADAFVAKRQEIEAEELKKDPQFDVSTITNEVVEKRLLDGGITKPAELPENIKDLDLATLTKIAEGKFKDAYELADAKVGPRQIVNVAAGQITADSTDAINGSQLYSVAKALNEKIVSDLASAGAGKLESFVFKGNTDKVGNANAGITLNKDNKTLTIGGTGVDLNKFDDGHNIMTFAEGEKITIAVKKAPEFNGLKLGKVGTPAANPGDPMGPAIPGMLTIIGADNKEHTIKVVDGAGALGDAADSKKPRMQVDGSDLATMADGYKITAGTKSANASLNSEIEFKGEGGLTTEVSQEGGKTVVTVKLSTTPSSSGSTLEVGANKPADEGGANPVEGVKELNIVGHADNKDKPTTDFDAGKNIQTTVAKDSSGKTTVQVALKKDLSVRSMKIGGDGKNGTEKGNGQIDLANEDGSFTTIAVNKEGASALGKTAKKPRLTVKGKDGVSEDIATLQDGLSFQGDGDKALNKTLNSTVKITGGQKDATKLSKAPNVGVMVEGDGENQVLAVRLSKNLTGLESAEFGDDVTVNASGLQIKDGPSVTKDGIDAGGKAIANVADGVKPTDATNFGQLTKTRNELRGQIETSRQDANAGTATAMAVGTLPQAYRPGQSVVGMSGSTYEGHTGFAVGVSTVTKNGKWILKGNVSGNGRGGLGASIGAGYSWD
ncbi:YadA domain protein [Taylorella equigenitalis 14/56]|uniref:YadA domain protein n=1 Tax=Taylorella equigenitalis 14/56 TaxID=1091497 RepID=I7JK91_9BURK|nr:ESPR-type extended signal peptide-containing protein [Taylorella equigenitalis]CCG18330.1 YadA domain protein [Taylorella equigenitalis 14/56]